MIRAIFMNYYFKVQVHSFKSLSTGFNVGVVGAPFAKGQAKSGVEKGPEALRNFGLLKSLHELGIDVKDYGDLAFETIENDLMKENIKFPKNVGSACKQLSEEVFKVLNDDRLCLTLGGDHSLGIGTVFGHSKMYHDLCVLWVDAHADINTEVTSMSGNMHGMSCSFLIHELQKYRSRCIGFDWLSPCVSKENFAYIGLRDIDPLEKLILKTEGIPNFSMRDVDRLGIFEVTNRALELINPTRKLSLHVSFDIDSIDKSITPSTGTPVLGGLTLREALCLAEEVSKAESLHAVDLVEVNPTVGNKEQIENTLSVAILVLKTIFGNSRGGNLPWHTKAIPVA